MVRLFKKKIIIKTYGGLGNQLFQLSAGIYFSNVTGHSILIDNSFYYIKKKNNTPRDFHLTKLYSFLKVLSFIEKGFLSIVNRLKVTNFFFIEINDNNLEDFRHKKLNKSIYLNGYFQNFQKPFIMEEKLKERMYIKDDFFLKNHISLHVRRGDYLKSENLNYFNTLDENHYLNAIELLRNKINLNNYTFNIFSDDINWCKKNLNLNVKLNFIENEDELFDFLAMKSCSHNIIANSTFSWWAAYLNDNSNKIVVAPKFWFTDKNRTFNYPQNWLKV